MLKINDIKPIVEIPDVSIYLYYGIIILSLFLCFFIIYIIYYFFKPKIKTQEQEWYEILQNLDLTNTKKSAYDISRYGQLLAQEERQKNLIRELNDELFLYKYKKEIPSEFTQNIKIKFSIFMDTLDVK